MADGVTINLPRWWALLLAGLLHGALLMLAFPPFDVWPLTFLMPLPLFWAAFRLGPKRVRRSLLVALGVIPTWWFQQSWLFDVAGLFYLLLALYLSAYVWIFVLLMGAWRERAGRLAGLPIALVAAVLWVGLEVVKGRLLLNGYAWFLLPQPLIALEALAAAASVVGTYGVSFLAALLIFGLAQVLGLAGGAPGGGGRRRTGWVAIFASVAVWTGLSVVGAAPQPKEDRHVRVGLVQTNVPQTNKDAAPFGDQVREFERFLQLTEQAAADPKPELIVWPETMVIGPGLNGESIEAYRRAKLFYNFNTPDGRPARIDATAFHDRLIETQARLGIPMLVGGRANEGVTIGTEPDGRISSKVERPYNSALMIRGGVVEEARYDKMRLMAFGEYMPYVSAFPRLADAIAGLGASGWTFVLKWGQTPTVFTLASGVRLVTPICFEASMPDHIRFLAYGSGERRADLIVTLTNDGWFGTGIFGRPQHLQMSQWRAIENGLPMVRSVNTGMAAVIDARGRLLASLPQHQDGVLVYNVPLADADHQTLFGRMGDVAGWTMLALSALITGWTVRPRRSPAAVVGGIK